MVDAENIIKIVDLLNEVCDCEPIDEVRPAAAAFLVTLVCSIARTDEEAEECLESFFQDAKHLMKGRRLCLLGREVH